MRQINIADAEGQLAKLIQAALDGEAVFIELNAEQVIQLVPISSPKGRKAGSAEGLIWMADDFDAPLEDFHEYM